MKLIEKLVPVTLRQDPKVSRSCQLIIVINFIVFISALLLVPVYQYIDYYPGALLMAYTAVNTLVFMAIMHKTLNLVLCANFFSFQSWLVFCALVATSGGTQSPYFVWLLTMAPVGAFYMKKRYSNIWLWLSVVAIATFGIIGLTNSPLPQFLNAKWHPLLSTMNYMLVLLLFVKVTKSFLASLRKVNSRLNRSNASLKRSNDDLERFAYIASHDLKSPLRNVTSFITLFKRRYGSQLPNSESHEYLDIALTNAEQMKVLIEDILDYSKANKKEIKQEEIDMNEMLLMICDQLRNRENYEDAEIEVWNLPSIFADRIRLQQLFQNLVENGLKYNQSSDKKVAVKYFDKNGMHHFVVEDNGIGIAKKYHERIFQMFERLHTRQTYNGTGIGLAICKKNVEELGGTISIESEEGKGTQFHIYIPENEFSKRSIPELDVPEMEEALL